jgi:hypothetical protein
VIHSGLILPALISLRALLIRLSSLPARMSDDGNSFVLPGLVRKRAELAGDIERTQADIQRMIRELEALDSTIKLFDADYQVEAIRPKTFRPPKDWANRGQMSRIVLNVLRQAAEPLTTRDIAFQLMKKRAMDTDDLHMLRLMTKRCGVALRGQRDKGVVRSEQGPGQYMMWGIKL